MSDQKPVPINEEDWTQTPTPVRQFITQVVRRLKQLEAQNALAKEDSRQKTGFSFSPPPTPEDELPSGYLLIVDDNEMNRDMLSRRLTRQGHRVEVAENGQQALEMLKTHNFDLIFLDIMMPEMNGYQVLEHLKADFSMPYIPVIMISAVDEIESIVRCIELGAEDYLPKPFNPVLLKARLGASLEKKRLRDRQEAYLRQLNIENQRKSEELEQARRIQQSMLPNTAPNVPYLDITAYQETASEVGGDYYDFFQHAEGKLFIGIGDATGHGVGSGLMVSMTKASLLATTETDLRVVIENLNAILNKVDLGIQLNMALTLVELSEVQPDGSLAVKASGGGMPPLYVFRADGRLEEFMVAGLPLGVTNEAVYALTEFQLRSGDTLLLMSDGLLEMFNYNLEFLSFDRLMASLKELDVRDLSAPEILQAVANIGHTWAKGHPLYDDVTLLVLKVK